MDRKNRCWRRRGKKKRKGVTDWWDSSGCWPDWGWREREKGGREARKKPERILSPFCGKYPSLSSLLVGLTKETIGVYVCLRRCLDLSLLPSLSLLKLDTSDIDQWDEKERREGSVCRSS